MSTPLISIILLAGGQGLRMNNPVPKQFLSLMNKPIALHSFELFASFPNVLEIIVVCDPIYRSLFPSLASPSILYASPGQRRQDSVFNGLNLVSDKAHLLCIHDSARPLLFRKDLENVISEAAVHGAAVLGVPVKPTIKQIDEEGFVIKTLERSSLWEVQTPQVMTPSLLKKGFQLAAHKDCVVTDDVSLVELAGHPVKIVQGSYQNLKITTSEDLALAEMLLSQCR
ncbi:MAG TPA: 2-C-methyl-D-erythritol 4-phosphate cytidylyltransferase [Rhabdochlamydiaceae bacterium]|nr:2-C-methyl-D-erythritol 4-phosphate cytidylyltransferase [Rhabdochlamydiaceae bacterium]